MSLPAELAERIKAMSPPDKLRFAAGLIEAAEAEPTKALHVLGMASSVAQTVHLELESVLLHIRARAMTNPRKT